MTNEEMVLQHLWEYGELSELTAYVSYGIRHLRRVVRKLKARGFDIGERQQERHLVYGTIPESVFNMRGDQP